MAHTRCWKRGVISSWKSGWGWKRRYWICSARAGKSCPRRPIFREYHARSSRRKRTRPEAPYSFSFRIAECGLRNERARIPQSAFRHPKRREYGALPCVQFCQDRSLQINDDLPRLVLHTKSEGSALVADNHPAEKSIVGIDRNRH